MKSRKQELMFPHVEAWKKCDNISQSDFAKALGLSKSTFNYWIRKYDALNASEITDTGFVELIPKIETNPVVLQKSSDSKNTEAASNREIKISLPGGVNITINI